MRILVVFAAEASSSFSILGFIVSCVFPFWGVGGSLCSPHSFLLNSSFHFCPAVGNKKQFSNFGQGRKYIIAMTKQGQKEYLIFISNFYLENNIYCLH